MRKPRFHHLVDALALPCSKLMVVLYTAPTPFIDTGNSSDKTTLQKRCAKTSPRDVWVRSQTRFSLCCRQKVNDVSTHVNMHSETAYDDQVNTGKAQNTSSAAETQVQTHAYPQFCLRAPVPAENALGTASEPHIASAEHCIGQIITSSPRHG